MYHGDKKIGKRERKKGEMAYLSSVYNKAVFKDFKNQHITHRLLAMMRKYF